MDADLVLTGGLIWYGPGAPVAAGETPTSIAIANGKVLAVGDDAELEAYVGPATRRIDLAGRRVIPGFMDSHTHFIAGGFELAGVQLRDASTPEEFARRIAEFASAHPAEWIIGGTWDHELWGGELPRRDWIDASTAHPGLRLQARRPHGAGEQPRARAGRGHRRDRRSRGGHHRARPRRPAHGHPPDNAMALVSDVIPSPSEAERDRALAAAVEPPWPAASR